MQKLQSNVDLQLLDRRIAAALDQRLGDRSQDTFGGGGMDAWQTSVENRLSSLDGRIQRLDEKIDRNFIITWGGLIALGLGLAGLMAKGFGWL
jgi:hypothetical protein